MSSTLSLKSASSSSTGSRSEHVTLVEYEAAEADEIPASFSFVGPVAAILPPGDNGDNGDDD